MGEGVKTVARCGIYETRPELCRVYPTASHYTPPECTFNFPAGEGGERTGECACDEGACCAVPREGGEPGGAPMPEVAGGEPCKHLIWTDVPMEKNASGLEIADGSAYGRQQLLRVLGHGD